MLIAPGRFAYDQLAFPAESSAKSYSNRLFQSILSIYSLSSAPSHTTKSLTMYSTTVQLNAAPFCIATILLGSATFIAKWAVNWLINPLRKVPGPQIASFTDMWRLWNALSGREEVINMDLHEKYGKNVNNWLLSNPVRSPLRVTR